MPIDRIVRRLACVVLAAVVAACNAPKSREAQVYDFVAGELLAATGEAVFAPNTDTRWFDSTPVDDFIADGRRSHGREPPWLDEEYVPLARAFFAANRTPGELDWRPRDERVRLLRGTFASKPATAEERDAMCFSSDAGEPVDVAVRRDGRFRHYRPYRTFSRIGFSADGEVAMLKVAKACAPLSGANETIIVVRRVDGEWKIVDGTMLWVS